MIVLTKESLIKEYFLLTTPIKYGCGCIPYEKQPQFKWLAQRGKCPEVLGSMPWRAHFFCMACSHNFCTDASTGGEIFAQMFCCEFWIMACSFGLPGARFLLVWAPGGRFLHGRISLAARFLCRCLHAANFGSSSMHAAAAADACMPRILDFARPCVRASKQGEKRRGPRRDLLW